MFNLDYRLTDDFSSTRRRLKNADEMDLRYDYFTGDIILENENCSFSTEWGWVTLLDFAASMKAIALDMGSNNIDEFEFTESDDKLIFKLSEHEIHISSSYKEGEIIVDLAQFKQACSALIERLSSELLRLYPELNENISFARIIQGESDNIKGSPFDQ